MKPKEMIYKTGRTVELLYNDIYKNYHYYILSLGTHPTAYVELTKNHKYFNKDYMDIDEIECHGGLTYSNSKLKIGINRIMEGNWFIGWDYAHYDDYSGYNIKYNLIIYDNGKKWSTKEIIEECKNVIDQLERINNV